MGHNRGTTGIWIKVNARSGYIDDVYLVARTDQEQAVIEGAFARITKPSCWRWIRRLIYRIGRFNTANGF